MFREHLLCVRSTSHTCLFVHLFYHLMHVLRGTCHYVQMTQEKAEEKMHFRNIFYPLKHALLSGKHSFLASANSWLKSRGQSALPGCVWDHSAFTFIGSGTLTYLQPSLGSHTKSHVSCIFRLYMIIPSKQVGISHNLSIFLFIHKCMCVLDRISCNFVVGTSCFFTHAAL